MSTGGNDSGAGTVDLTPRAVPSGGTHEARDAEEEVAACLAACRACAAACLDDPAGGERTACIRACLDTAAVLGSAAALLAPDRLGDTGVVAAVLRATVAACRACAGECNRHADHDEHCADCASACERCAVACELLLEQLTPQSTG